MIIWPRALCRLALSHYTGVDPATWVFTAGKYGKPAIARPAAFRAARFNLSHTDGLIVCAVGRAGEIGIDVEDTSRQVDIVQISRHFFSADEEGASFNSLGERAKKPVLRALGAQRSLSEGARNGAVEVAR